MKNNKPFNPETLADRWDCSATSIRNLCASGKLAHFRLGKLYRIPQKSVEEFENGGQTGIRFQDVTVMDDSEVLES